MAATRNNTRRFIQRDINPLHFNGQRMPVHRNAVFFRVYLSAQNGYRLSIHRDTSFTDQVFTMAPGAMPGFGEVFL